MTIPSTLLTEQLADLAARTRRIETVLMALSGVLIVGGLAVWVWHVANRRRTASAEQQPPTVGVTVVVPPVQPLAAAVSVSPPAQEPIGFVLPPAEPDSIGFVLPKADARP